MVAVPPKFAEGDAGRMLNVRARKQLLFFGFDNDNDSVDVTDMTVGESQVDFARIWYEYFTVGSFSVFSGCPTFG